MQMRGRTVSRALVQATNLPKSGNQSTLTSAEKTATWQSDLTKVISFNWTCHWIMSPMGQSLHTDTMTRLIPPIRPSRLSVVAADTSARVINY